MKKIPELQFHPLLATSIVFQLDQNTVSNLCTSPFKGHKNGCPNYNHNWSCPPNAPSVEKIKSEIQKFSTFWLVYIVIKLPKKNILQSRIKFGIKNSAALQTLYLNHFLDFIKEHSKKNLVLHASHCELCKERGYKNCSFPDKSCRFPKNIRVSPEASGVDLFKTMEKAGLKIEKNPKNYVTRIGLIGSNGNLNLNLSIAEFNKKVTFK